MKANATPRVNADPSIERELREHALIINLLADSRAAGLNNATTSAPTTGSYAKRDFVPNIDPVELGVAGFKYVILGWMCINVSPLAFVECRFLTGN